MEGQAGRQTPLKFERLRAGYGEVKLQAVQLVERRLHVRQVVLQDVQMSVVVSVKVA